MLVFGHRGACGYLPENTIESMELAFELGADAVEFDVVFTKDGHGVIRHDIDLASTTDISDHSFLSSKVDQLNLEDVIRLRAKERYPDGRAESAANDGKFFVPTLVQVLRNPNFDNRHLIIEIKSGDKAQGDGLHPIEFISKALSESDWRKRGMTITFEAFEFQFLKQLKSELGGDFKFVFLVAPDTVPDIAMGLEDNYLEEIAQNFDGISLAISMVLVGDLVVRAKSHGMPVYIYTARVETAEGNVEKWFERLITTGADGIFADQPDLVLKSVADLP